VAAATKSSRRVTLAKASIAANRSIVIPSGNRCYRAAARPSGCLTFDGRRAPSTEVDISGFRQRAQPRTDLIAPNFR
jgi:hypothetical protein